MSLEVKDLLVIRGAFSLEADFSLQSGRVLVLLGPSGCGKTTLLRAIAGLEPIQHGTITLDGARIDGLPTEKRNIGFVFQDLALFEQMRVEDNIGYGLSVRHENKKHIHEKVLFLARRFRIEHLLKRYPPELSGGERQRVAFARVIASEPSLMLLDEPLSALDAPLRREMRRFIRRQLAEGHLTAIHVTHDVEEAIDLADEIIVVRDGKMVGRGGIEDLEKNPGSGWLARFMNLGLVLPVTKISPADGLGPAFEVRTIAGTVSYASPEGGADVSALTQKACLYVPSGAVASAGAVGTAKIKAKVVRSIRNTLSVPKLVLMIPEEENYYFELPLKGDGPDIYQEGTDIELSINTRLCQLLPEDPPLCL
jgi:ABC-type Fe3+/spermidine/putrescine transport system ATPase subunit